MGDRAQSPPPPRPPGVEEEAQDKAKGWGCPFDLIWKVGEQAGLGCPAGCGRAGAKARPLAEQVLVWRERSQQVRQPAAAAPPPAAPPPLPEPL